MLRRVFEKRHICEHNRGIITDRYVPVIPEHAQLLGMKAALSLDELTSGAKLLRHILDNLIHAIEGQNSS